MTTRTAWELIGHEGTFRLVGGHATYEAVMYNEATARSNRVRLARLESVPGGLRQVNRWVDPDALLEVLEDFDAPVAHTYAARKDAKHGVWQILEDGNVIAVRERKSDADELVNWWREEAAES